MGESNKCKEQPWIFIRGGEVSGVFENRKKAVKYYKKLLEQTLKDLKNQDKTDEYDYPIKVFEIEIKPIEERKAYLGL